MGQKHIFGTFMFIDLVRLVSKEMTSLIKVFIFSFGIKMGGKNVITSFEIFLGITKLHRFQFPNFLHTIIMHIH